MPPQGAKVWNEDLVKALRARADQKRQQGSQNFIGLQQAADAIEGSRKDIYAFKNGRVVNLPQTGLGISTGNLCRDIIAGKQPVLPPGYVATRPEDRTTGNPFANHPYLTKMKLRSGAFAILMAFHLSQRATMTKDDIVATGQRFCDEEMEANYHAGRSYGAWKGNDTLKKHGLITSDHRVQFRPGRGFRSLGKASYTLTRDGEKFIDALLDRHPHIRQEVESARLPVAEESLQAPPQIHHEHARYRSTTTPKKKSGALNELSKKDIGELQIWAATAMIGSQKAFKVGKDRRRNLHDACDNLNLDLIKSGKCLRHESSNSGKSRIFYVTMTPFHTSNVARPAMVSPPQEKPEQSTSNGFHSLGARRALFDSEDSGYTLNGLGTPPKRARQLPRPSVAAGTAALERQAVHESLVTAGVCKSVSTIGGNDSDRKMPARSKKTPPIVSSTVFINLVDSDEDEILATAQSSLFPPFETKPNAESTLQDIVDLTDSPDISPPIPPIPRIIQNHDKNAEDTQCVAKAPKKTRTALTIFVDDRERNRNATPRLMRMELTRLVSSGILSEVRKDFESSVDVVEKNLKSGDFAFSVNQADIVEPLLERKTVADIVQRSFKKHHWFQLACMRDSTSPNGVCFLLIEGDFRTAVQFTPYGAQQDGEDKPSSHVIDSEESLIRFLGRAILSSKKVRVLQTKDTQGSLRAVGATALVAASKSTAEKVSTKNPAQLRSDLSDHLRKLGIPFQLAGCIADEVGSKRQLDFLYGSTPFDECRELLLVPILHGLNFSELSGNAAGWSRAVYWAYTSVHPKRFFVKQSFTTLMELVEDKALLLEKLHTCASNDEALNSVYDSLAGTSLCPQRKVWIDLPHDLHKCFPRNDSGNSVFDITEHGNDSRIPCMTMQTKDGRFSSEKLALFILEGKDFIALLRNQIESCKSSAVAAGLCSTSIRSDCCSSDMYNQTSDSCVVVIRGLNAAMDRWAKTVGYRSEFRAVVDLVIADLSIAQNTVVLHAVRLTEDLDTLLQNLALSCYHYHLLVRKDSSKKNRMTSD